MLYLLDTDIVSYALKAKSQAIENRLKAIPTSQWAVSVITQAELLYGLKALTTNHPCHAAVWKWLRLLPVLAWEPEASEFYADIRHQFTSTGQPIGVLDMMIAAYALALGATLVTNNNRHYERINASLLLENWAK
jgi:tRNA(fMet)-specific endonuclease VapC